MDIYARQIQQAMSSAIDTTKLAEAWQALHPAEVGKAQWPHEDMAVEAVPPGRGDSGRPAQRDRSAGGHDRRQAVRGLGSPAHDRPDLHAKAISPVLSAFLARASAAIVRALSGILPNAWTEGWVLGQVSATALVNGGEVDWGAWKPGDARAAAAIAGPGLRQLLLEQDVRIKSIAQSRLEELAAVLERTLSSDVTERPLLPAPLPPQLSVSSLADQLKDVLDLPERATLVAQTEIARAQAEASRTVYRETGRSEVEISTAEDDKVCPVCQAAEEAGPHPIGQPPMVPIHPRCRCAELPVLVGAS